jgi:hypothetical protein
MVLAFATAIHRPANPQRGVDDTALRWSLIVTGIAAGALVAVYVWLRWLVARHERRRRQFGEVAAPQLVNSEPPPAPPAPAAPPLNWWVGALLVGLVVLMVLGGKALGDSLRAIHPAVFFVVPFLAIGGVVAALFLLFWLGGTGEMRLSRQAIQLANEGDVDGGIALLEAERQRRGDRGALLNDLSVLYSQKKDWARALELIDAQIALTPQLPHVHSNRGLYLLRMGRLDDAEQAFRAAGPSLGDDPIYLCNYAELLLDLGRPNDAAQLLAQAQTVLDASCYTTHEDRQVRADEIYRLRLRLPPGIGVQSVSGPLSPADGSEGTGALASGQRTPVRDRMVP